MTVLEIQNARIERLQRDFERKGYTLPDQDARKIYTLAQSLLAIPQNMPTIQMQEWNLQLSSNNVDKVVLVFSYCRGNLETIAKIDFNMNPLMRVKKFDR
jgi:hypothetical protein